MRAYHNTREARCRTPFGAVTIGQTVKLTLDVWEEPEAVCTLRLWVDGKGETLLPMERAEREDFCRYTVEVSSETPDLLWYSFLIQSPRGFWRYGAKEGSTGGEGKLYDWEPPSFQITVSRPSRTPAWYKNAIVYQIFPDRFYRGKDWKPDPSLLKGHENGPERFLAEDWDQPPRYQRDEAGRITAWEFHGGTLRGILEKLPELRDMGITALYLNPIFEAASNHRYDTGDYCRIDPLLGSNEDFEELCRTAEDFGISIILDGVFNHTGCDSRYFNKYGNYDSLGAYQSENSPYRSWYRFDGSPAGYDCWWGVDDLPCVEEDAESYRRFIYDGPDSIVRRWLRAGAKGWRLDVADELPDDFITGIKKAILEERPRDGFLLGEVWEDASNKISYSRLRRYLLGDELDAAMNYPLRDGVEGFVKGEIPAEALHERIMTLYENYPREAFYSALNLMGSHDRMRVMSILGDAPPEHSLSDQERAEYRLSEAQRNLAKGRLWLVVLLQMTLPGVPCIYYGDEAGLEGYADPYNRAPFPWGKEDPDTQSIYRNALSLRRLYPVLVDGDFQPFFEGEDVFGFFRRNGEDCMAVLVNRSLSEFHTVTIPAFGERAEELVGGLSVELEGETASVTLAPMGSAVIHFPPKAGLAAPMRRGSGVLCHITSLPSETGAGFLGKPALAFVDFLRESGQKYWQILPLNPTDEHGSPYAGTSAFAGNLALLGMTEGELQKAFAAFTPTEDYRRFCQENAFWLDAFALFSAIKARTGGTPWQQWPEAYRSYDPALYRDETLAQEAAFYQFCQYTFQTRWLEIRGYANRNGIQIIGDLPMYVSADSADAWAAPEMFTLDAAGYPTLQAGVPPDYFSEEGQLWGNPLYRWDAMEKDGYSWWLGRLERAFSLYDAVRLDHFRGFESYWAIPAGKKAVSGKWLFGPGPALFEAAYRRFGPLPLVAEDLGMITPAVRGLVARCGFAGTDVLQFFNGDPRMGYTPPKGKVAYSGTHDNATLLGWSAERYPDEDPEETAAQLLENLFRCDAQVVIVPLQDVLGLGDEARMNTPGTVGNNWQWQAKQADFRDRGETLLDLTIKTNRR